MTRDERRGATRRSRLPLADAAALALAARRTRVLALVLALALAGVGAATYLLAPRPTGQVGSLVGGDGATVVVLDVSASISDLVFREIARTLEGVAAAAGDGGRVGLVLFSDEALEAFPPGASAAQLAAFARYFRPLAERGTTPRSIRARRIRTGGAALPQGVVYPLSPWGPTFSGGTRISAGLRMAREVLARDASGGGRVVLVSDLDEAEKDRPDLTAELLTYARDPGLDLRVVALPATGQSERELFERVRGDAVVQSLELATGAGHEGEPASRVTAAFLACVALLGAGIAVLVVGLTPLRFTHGAAGRMTVAEDT